MTHPKGEIMKYLLVLMLLLAPGLLFGSDDSSGHLDYVIQLEGAGGSLDLELARGWKPEVLLSENDGQESISPRFVADSGGTLHMVWKDNWHAYNEVVYRLEVEENNAEIEKAFYGEPSDEDETDDEDGEEYDDDLDDDDDDDWGDSDDDDLDDNDDEESV